MSLSVQQRQPEQEQPPQTVSRKVAKTTTAVTIGTSLMVLSSLTLAATVIGLAIATPLLVIFSPVIVPATISVFLILAGFLASGGFTAVASFVLYWMYRLVSGKGLGLEGFRDKLMGREGKEQTAAGR